MQKLSGNFFLSIKFYNNKFINLKFYKSYNQLWSLVQICGIWLSVQVLNYNLGFGFYSFYSLGYSSYSYY